MKKCFRRKKATAEMTTALLCRANVKKDTFRTVAEYLEDCELKSILHVCAEILNARGASQSEMLAKMKKSGLFKDRLTLGEEKKCTN